eukprot:5917295-Lingulodinium_polyedra.AAC.1
MPSAPPLTSTRSRASSRIERWVPGYQRLCAMGRTQSASPALPTVVSWRATGAMVWGTIVAQYAVPFSRLKPWT